jgi:hypothetical protein
LIRIITDRFKIIAACQESYAIPGFAIAAKIRHFRGGWRGTAIATLTSQS